MKVFKVSFDVNVECGGVWKQVPVNLSIPANSPEEARQNFKENITLTDVIKSVEPYDL